MLMWFVVAALILAGLTLLVIEVVFIPGTTVVGLLGLAFIIVGVVFTYSHFGNEAGFYVLSGTGVSTALALYLSFRGGAWKKFALNDSSKGKVNEGKTSALQIGDEGITLSTLRPMGKAEFNEKTFEVKTLGSYIERGVRVKIINLNSNQIIVEPLTD